MSDFSRKVVPEVQNQARNLKNDKSEDKYNADQYENDLAAFRQCERKFEIGVGVVDITLEQQVAGKMETPEIVE